MSVSTYLGLIVLTCGSSSLRTFEAKDAVVAKLFAKHIKLADAIEYVKRTRCAFKNPAPAIAERLLTLLRIGIGVGTPERLIALLDAGTWNG